MGKTIGANRRLAKKRAQCLNEVLCPSIDRFIAGRQFCASSIGAPSLRRTKIKTQKKA
jgi:hypothetical protein